MNLKSPTHIAEHRTLLSGTGELGKWGHVGQRVQSFSYVGWISSGDLMLTVSNTVWCYLKFAKKVDLKCCHIHDATMWGNGYANELDHSHFTMQTDIQTQYCTP